MDPIAPHPVDRRADRRLEIDFPVAFHPAPPDAASTPAASQTSAPPEREIRSRGTALNVAPGGVYFETEDDSLKSGQLIELEMTLPPAAGSSPYFGRGAAVAEVLRVVRLPTLSPPGSAPRFGVAARFRERLRLNYRTPF